jgi:predicted MFS family arabinose efflux permease
MGYSLNLLAVPALALTSHWFPAAGLVLLERVGKALRTPARDAMLSFATSRTGHGWGFGLHEALDQVGATAGPLLVATIVAAHSEYRPAFAWLLLPATAALALLFLARFLFPQPRDLHVSPEAVAARGLPRAFWIYLAGACCVAAGYADYALIAYHFQQSGHISTSWIAVLYAIAMVVDGLAALAFGRWFDRAGLRVLLLATILSALAPVFLFRHSFAGAVAGVVLWGIGLGAQESVLRAAVAHLAPLARRGSAYGIFNMGFGFAWFGGSTVLGFLYSRSIPALMLFAAGVQLVALPLFWEAGRAARKLPNI